MENKAVKLRETGLSVASIPQILKDIGSPWGEAVEIEVRRPAIEAPDRAQRDFDVDMSWGSMRQQFVAEAKAIGTPKAVKDAMESAKKRAKGDPEARPMVIVPFLSSEQIEELISEDVSGLDLCGNGVIIVPGRALLIRTGQPKAEQYYDSRPTKFAYRGRTSLIPRAFLCKPEYASVGEIQEEIKSRGGHVVLSTVSKALARMVEDVIVARESGSIRLVQPDKLLDMLAEQFELPKAIERARIKGELREVFAQAGSSSMNPLLVLSGASSQGRYSAGLRSDDPVLYCRNLRRLKDAMGERWKPDDRFGDLVIVEPDDMTPFFDARRGDDGIVYASPVQAYLELAATKEKRDGEMSLAIRRRILE